MDHYSNYTHLLLFAMEEELQYKLLPATEFRHTKPIHVLPV